MKITAVQRIKLSKATKSPTTTPLGDEDHCDSYSNAPASDDDETISELGSDSDSIASSVVLADICPSQLVQQVEHGEKRKK